MSEQAELSLQIACENTGIPTEAEFALWQQTALRSADESRNGVTIRIVGIDEMTALNRDYRGQDKPTNVLSFAFEPIEGVEMSLLGDIAICASVVAAEASTQKKTSEAHWAHMTVHGILHLCGYDHIEDDEAEEMEALEIKTLAALDYPNPYLVEDKI